MPEQRTSVVCNHTQLHILLGVTLLKGVTQGHPHTPAASLAQASWACLAQGEAVKGHFPRKRMGGEGVSLGL